MYKIYLYYTEGHVYLWQSLSAAMRVYEGCHCGVEQSILTVTESKRAPSSLAALNEGLML